MRNIAAFMAFWLVILIQSATVSAQQRIEFEVLENNRIFKAGEALRYEDDLQLYLRCADRLGATLSKCSDYIARAIVDDRKVPHLRGGDHLREYATYYNKEKMDYERGYATDPTRKLRFYLRGDLAPTAENSEMVCHWRLRSSIGELLVEVESKCSSSDFEIKLGADPADGAMRFSGSMDVVVRNAAGLEIGQAATKVNTRDYLLVAFGDSFTSGEGNPERNRMDGSPSQWLDYRCHRSVFSYPVILSQMLALADPRHSVTLVHLACSGARATIGVTKPYRGVLNREQMQARWSEFDGWFGKATSFPERWRKYGTSIDTLPPQVEQAQQTLQSSAGLRRRPDLVVMSIGVNDMGEVPFIKAIALENYDSAAMKKSFSRVEGMNQDECFFDTVEPSGEAQEKVDDSKRLKIGFDCLQRRLIALSTSIKSSLDPHQVFLMEYHDPLQDEDGRTCGLPEHRQLLDGFLGQAKWYKRFLGPLLGKGELTAPELKFAHDQFFKPFTRALEEGAQKSSWLYVKSRGAEHKRGFCSSRASWYHDYRASRARQGLLPGDDIVSTGTLHPNTFGHYYSALRALLSARDSKVFGAHNINCIRGSAMAASGSGANPDGTYGFAWYIWNKDNANVEKLGEKYHAFRRPDSPCA